MHTVLDQQAESATQARKMLKPTLKVRWAHNTWVSFYQRKKGGEACSGDMKKVNEREEAAQAINPFMH